MVAAERKMKMMTSFCRLAVGVLLLIAGVLKARDQGGFRAALGSYNIIPRGMWMRILAASVTAAEVGIGFVVAVGLFFPFAGIAAVLMLAGFSLAVAITLVRVKTRPGCGCMVFGRKKTIGWDICVRNIALSCLLLPSITSLPPLPFLIAASLLLSVALTSVKVENAGMGLKMNLKNRSA